MKKYIFYFLLPLLMWGCEKKYNSVVEPNQTKFQVNSTANFNTFEYTPDDSILTITIGFSSVEGLNGVYCDIISSDNVILNSSPLNLYDNGNANNGDQVAGDKIYSNIFPLSTFYPNGTYRIIYYTNSQNNNSEQIAIHNFTYNNGQNNAAPVISNLVINPDTAVVTNQTVVILISIAAADSNGLNDIQSVFYKVYRPDSTTNGLETQLFDDGDTQTHGDITAGDGIYSRLIQADSTSIPGTYRFEFNARDRGHKLSNTINHNIVIIK